MIAVVQLASEVIYLCLLNLSGLSLWLISLISTIRSFLYNSGNIWKQSPVSLWLYTLRR